MPVGCLWVLTLIAGTARKAVARTVWCAGLFSRMSGGRGCRSFAFSGHVASGGRPRTFSRFHCRLTNDPYRSLAQLVTKQCEGVGALDSRPLFDSATPLVTEFRPSPPSAPVRHHGGLLALAARRPQLDASGLFMGIDPYCVDSQEGCG